MAAVAAACLVGAATVAARPALQSSRPCNAGQAGGTCTRAWFVAYPSLKGCTQFLPLVHSKLGLSALTATRGLIQNRPVARREDLDCNFALAGATDKSQNVMIDFLDRGVGAVNIQQSYSDQTVGMAGCLASADADPSTKTPLSPLRTVGVGSQSLVVAPCPSGFILFGDGSVVPEFQSAMVRVGVTRWLVSAPPSKTSVAQLVALTRTLVANYH